MKDYCNKLQWQRATDLQAVVPPTQDPKIRERALKHEKAGRLLRALAWLFVEADKMSEKGEIANRQQVKDLKVDIRVLILNAMNFILGAFVQSNASVEKGDATVKPFMQQYGRWIYRDWVYIKLLCSETVRERE